MQKLLLICLVLFSGIGYAQTPAGTAKLQPLSPYYILTPQQEPQGRLNKEKATGTFSVSNNGEESFSIKMKVRFQPFEKEQEIMEIPGVTWVRIRQADPNNRQRENYPASPMPDGSVPIVEAVLRLGAKDINVFTRDLEIGFPLAALKNPWGEHELVLHFSRTSFSIYANSELMDNDFAIGYPRWGTNTSWTIDPALISEAALYKPGMNATRNNAIKPAPVPLQYWLPHGHNSWVGDVASIYHEGRYHVFYLYDRRHHDSKFGTGGHYFEHISTTDFINWTEHETATPIEEQWETFGTGTPFVYQGKLHLAYGYHTGRIYPDSLTAYPKLFNYFTEHQKTGSFEINSMDVYPSGSSYSVSEDGVSNFKKSKKLFHYGENPSVFIDREGKLKMYANFKSKGTWASESLDGGWYPVDANFPDGGDCTMDFTWGKFDYIVGGFVNLWRRPAGSTGAWTDLVKEGTDFYNGNNVPAVTPIGNGRYIMAGWLPVTGWGGPFFIHELIQYKDGRLGTKWMKEMMPAAGSPAVLAASVKGTASIPVTDENFILSFDVQVPKKQKGRIALSFLPADGSLNNGCELQLNLDSLLAQYANARADVFAAPEKSLRQGGITHGAVNYAIENLNGVDKSFRVRILVKRNSKLGGTIIDTEIAGQNTLVTYRNGLSIGNISFRLEQAGIRNLVLQKIED